MNSTNLPVKVEVALTVDGRKFLLFIEDDLLHVTDEEDKVLLTSYNMVGGLNYKLLESVARGVAASIIERIIRPSMILMDEKELLKFYLTLVNIISLFSTSMLVRMESEE